MDFSRMFRLPSDGWRKTAVINTSIVGFFAIANLSTLFWSLSKTSVSENNVFSSGDCSKISLLNTSLHLLLNIASSLIIASSNFFMQVLNSPTRAEVDQAHARKRWLEIGVPSLRNVLHVSPYKSVAWLFFSLSSIPIHLLFNSAVFTVDYSGSQWSMALVSESFLHGAPYSLPGAALTLEGTKCKMQDPGYYVFGEDDHGFQNSSQRLADVVATVKATATQNLSLSDCKSEYQTCQGLRKYRNLLLVVDSGGGTTDSQGWNISDIYDIDKTVGSVYDLSRLELSEEGYDEQKLQNETFNSIWGFYFENASISQPNSLWFGSECYKQSNSSGHGCYNSCTGPLGIGQSYDEAKTNETEVKNSQWEFPWWRGDYSVPTLRPRSSWGEVLDNTTWMKDNPGLWPNLCKGIPQPAFRNESTNDIHVKYCLAEPFEQGCKVAISNLLLSVVTVCIFIKLALSISVVLALRDDPLVTPGDAVSSFIAFPDSNTVGRWAAATQRTRSCPLEPKPRQWQRRPKRLASTISPANWIMNYVFFLILLIILGVVMDDAFFNYPLSNV